MKRKSDTPLEKVTLNLFKGDFDRLRDLHGRLGGGMVVRTLVRAHIKKVEEEAAQRPPPDAQMPLFQEPVNEQH